jgi:hypothetical protein
MASDATAIREIRTEWSVDWRGHSSMAPRKNANASVVDCSIEWAFRAAPSRRGSTGSSPLTDPVVQNYRSGFLRCDSPRRPKVV